MKFLTKSLLMFALILTMNLNIQAQESAPTLAIEEIIVTARKKEESIQDVPMAVTAITDQLGEGSVRRLEDIQAFAPNLFINRTSNFTSLDMYQRYVHIRCSYGSSHSFKSISNGYNCIRF